MKKSTLFILSVSLLSAGVLKAEEGMSEPQEVQTPSQEPPLLLAAAALPAQPVMAPNPLQHLPGMSPIPAQNAALPVPLISDLTNAPNPFDSRKSGLEGQTQISYSLSQDAKASVDIYDLLGRKVRGWVFAAGSNGGRLGANTVLWDGTNSSGQKVAKGGYLAEIVIETSPTTVTAIRKIGVIH